ncbi:MAG: hypothetical protein Q8P22_09565 [Chloroflexota bacterium]|nr:hypothetical protein [Chloroflexota bacterium]
MRSRSDRWRNGRGSRGAARAATMLSAAAFLAALLFKAWPF